MIDLLKQAGYVMLPDSGIWQRPGYAGIAYSDGDAVETRIRNIVDQAQDLSVLSSELRAHCTDWPSLYHLTSLRANLLRPFTQCLKGNVLEIGAGCGAITRFLGESGANVLALEGSPRRAGIARSRTRDLPNVTVLTETFDEFAVEQQFDVVTLIGVLEYANLFVPGDTPALSFLRKIRGLLKPGGYLLLAIENQLGLKYFAGAPEDHLGISMFGIEDRYQNNGPQTFGRLELDELLCAADFTTRDFLTPLPDYKMPVSIVTAKGLSDESFDASALAVSTVVRDNQLARDTSFELQLAWPPVIKNGLGLELANSFLVCASPSAPSVIDQDILGFHYSAERLPQFCKQVTFQRVANEGISVECRSLSNLDGHVRATDSLQFCPDANSAYHVGTSMFSEFLDLVNRDRWTIEELAAFMGRYLAMVEELSGVKFLASDRGADLTLPSESFDLIPQNIIRGIDGRMRSFDLEWSASFPIEPTYLLFRALFVSLGGLHRCAPPADGTLQTWKDLIQAIALRCHMPISDELYAHFLTRELTIRQDILGAGPTDVETMAQYMLPIAVSYEQLLTELRSNLAVQEQAAKNAEAKARVEREELVTQLNQMRNSRSWRVTAPMRFLARSARHGVLPADRERLVSAVRNRYHRLPLPPVLKRSLSKIYHGGVSRVIARFRRNMTRQLSFTPPTLPVREKNANLPDYFVWGVIDWHFRYQRPQHLAAAIGAAGRRVFYISPTLVDDDRPGFDVEALNSGGTLFQVKLYVAKAPVIYTGVPTHDVTQQLRRSVGELIDWVDATQVISLVQHPFWQSVAAFLPNSRVVYDCMDLHEGFDNFASELLQSERSLLEKADLVVTTSTWLDEIAARHTQRRTIVRNAGEYHHFNEAPAETYSDPQGRRIIGYYGAIAEWFDVELVRKVADSFPDCVIVLIGADTVNAKEKLKQAPNVQLLGEVPYDRLPFYLHAFDVCLLPFQVVPLTLATNPVKAYEYLSAGKPVVSVDLPEMRQFGDLVYVAQSHTHFIDSVRVALNENTQSDLLPRRQSFAKGQTWEHRAADLLKMSELSGGNPLVSIIVVTYNNLDLTKACLASIDTYSQYSPIEIIVVDNASSDGSPEYLREWESGASNRRLILNEDNRGFAAANNQGLACAQGEYLVLLNNDTHVTPGWIKTLIQHLGRDERIGLIGPVTNNIGNEARIEISYENMDEMLKASARYTRQHIGQFFEFPTAAFFCVMLPRRTYEEVGDLDEQFGLGFFEDDDYCRRIEKIGKKVVCAEDVFIHHHLSASFNKLRSADRQALFERNKAQYEAKWGPWMPHRYREPSVDRDEPSI